MAYMTTTSSSHYSVQPLSHSSLAHRHSKYATPSTSEFHGRRKPLSQIDYGPPRSKLCSTPAPTSAWHYTAPLCAPETDVVDAEQQHHTLLAQWCSLHDWRGEPLAASSNIGGQTTSQRGATAGPLVTYFTPVAANAFYATADDVEVYGQPHKNAHHRVQFETWSGRSNDTARALHAFNTQNLDNGHLHQAPAPLQTNQKLPKKLQSHSTQNNYHTQPKFEADDDPLYIQHEDGDKNFNSRKHVDHNFTDIGPSSRNPAKTASAANTIYRSHSSRNDFIKPPSNLPPRRPTAFSMIGTSSKYPQPDSNVYAVPSFYHRFRPSTRSDDVKQVLPTRLAENSTTKLRNGSPPPSKNNNNVRKSNSIKRWQRVVSTNTTKPAQPTSTAAALPPRENSQTRRTTNYTHHTAITQINKDTAPNNGVGTMVSSLKLRLLGGAPSKSSTTLKPTPPNNSDFVHAKNDHRSVAPFVETTPANEVDKQSPRVISGYQTPNSMLRAPKENDYFGSRSHQATSSKSSSLISSGEVRSPTIAAANGNKQAQLIEDVNHFDTQFSQQTQKSLSNTAIRPQKPATTTANQNNTTRSSVNSKSSNAHNYEEVERIYSKKSSTASQFCPERTSEDLNANRVARFSTSQKQEECSKNNNENASSRTNAEDIIMCAQTQRNSIPFSTLANNAKPTTKTLLASDEQTSSVVTTSRCALDDASGTIITATEAAGTTTKASAQACTTVPAKRCNSNNSANNEKRNKHHDNDPSAEETAINTANRVRQQSIPARTPTPSPHVVLLGEIAKRRKSLFAATTTDDTPADKVNTEQHFLTLRLKSAAAASQQQSERRRVGVERNDTPTPPNSVVACSLSSQRGRVTASVSTTFEKTKRPESNYCTSRRDDETTPVLTQFTSNQHKSYDSRSILLASPVSSIGTDCDILAGHLNKEYDNRTLRRQRRDSSTFRENLSLNSRPASTTLRDSCWQAAENSNDVFTDDLNRNDAETVVNNRNHFVEEVANESKMKSLKSMLRLNSSNCNNNNNSSSHGNHFNATSRSNSVIVNPASNKASLYHVPVLFSTDYYTPIVISPYNSSLDSSSATANNNYPSQTQQQGSPAEYNIYSAATSLSSASDNTSSHYNSSAAAQSIVQNHSIDVGQVFPAVGYATPAQANAANNNSYHSVYHARSASGLQPPVPISSTTVLEPAGNVLPPPPPPLSPSVIRRQKIAPAPPVRPQPATNNLNVSRRASEHLNLNQLNKLNTVVAATAARRRRESLIESGGDELLPLAPDCNQHQKSQQHDIKNLPLSRSPSASQPQALTASQLPASRAQSRCDFKPKDADQTIDVMRSDELESRITMQGIVAATNCLDAEPPQHFGLTPSTIGHPVVDGRSDWRHDKFDTEMTINPTTGQCTGCKDPTRVGRNDTGSSVCNLPASPTDACALEESFTPNSAPVLPVKEGCSRHSLLFTRQQALRRVCPSTQQHQKVNAFKEQPFIMIRKPRMRAVSTDRSDSRFQRLSLYPTSEYERTPSPPKERRLSDNVALVRSKNITSLRYSNTASPAICNVEQKPTDSVIVSSPPLIKTDWRQVPDAAVQDGHQHRWSPQAEIIAETSSRSSAIHIIVPSVGKSSSTATTNSDSSDFGGGNSFEADSVGCENTLLAPSRTLHPNSLPQLPSLSMPSGSPSLSYFVDTTEISKDAGHQNSFIAADQKSVSTQNTTNLSTAAGIIDYDYGVRGQLVNEIIQNERDYVKNLRDIVEGYLYKCRERSDMFSKGRIELIFGNVEQIYEFQSDLLSSLEQSLSEQVSKRRSSNIARRLSTVSSAARGEPADDSELNNCSTADANLETSFSSDQEQQVADADANDVEDAEVSLSDLPPSAPSNECLREAEIGHWFLMHRQGFAELYTEYCINHSQACAELRQLLQITQYRYFFEACRRLRDMIDIPLSGFLLQPVQKICKYPLQLQELLKSTPSSHADHESVKLALRVMTQTTTLVNERKRRLECLEKIALFQHTVQQWEGEDLLERSSTLLHHGELQRVGGQTSSWNKDYHFFLFDHQLLYCKRDMLKRSLLYKSRFDLNQCTVEVLPPHNDLCVKHGFRIWCQSKARWFVFSAKTTEDRVKWLKAFADERRMVGEDHFHKFHIQPRHRLSAIEQAQKILLSNRGKKITYRDALKDLEEHRASTLTPAKRSRSLSFPSRLKSAGDLSDLAKNNNVANWAALMDQSTEP